MTTPNEQTGNPVLKTLFAHNVWANLKLLDFCETLTQEQLRATAPGTYGSILGTLIHIIGGELSYVERTNGHVPSTPLVEGVLPTFAALKEMTQWANDELLLLAQSAQADTLVEERSEQYKVVVRYPLASLIMQEINHANEHRAHICTILSHLGLEPLDITGWGYMEATGEFQESKLDP